MDRIVDKQVKSITEAYLQVCEQYPTPDYASMSDAEFDALVRKSGNPEGLIARRKNQLERAAIERTRRGYTAGDAKADQERAKVEAENKRRAARGEDPLPVPGGSQLKDPRPAVSPTSAPKPPTDQEKVRTEYDRLRNSTDPKERAQAVTYGRQMAAAGASKSNFSGYQSASDAQKNLPAPAQRMSISQRIQAIRNIRAAKPAASTPAVKPAASTPAVKPAASTPAISPNQQSSLNSAVKSGTSQVPTGNTVKTKMNPDSSLSVTQKRSSEATKKIKQSLELQSADLFDIIQGEFIEEGYTQEDTVYMMANLNEEQLQEFMQYVQRAINVGKRIPGIKGVINKVGGMFNRAPKQMPAGQVGALRLYQDKARQSVNRLNQQTPKLDARAAQREANRVNNLNPTAVSNRNRREAAAQMRQRNRELGRPESAGVQPVDRLDYKSGDPMFDDFVKRHHADKRGGVVKFTDGARRIDK
jgi:hypothetical protein